MKRILHKTQLSMKNILLSLKSNHSRNRWRSLPLIVLLMCFHWITASSQQPVITKTECGCMNNETQFGNGQFNETITVTAPAGQNWVVVSSVGLYSTASPPPPGTPIVLAANTVIPEGPAGVYVLAARRLDNTKYSAVLSNGISQFTVNATYNCRYPRNEILGDFGACIDSENKTYRLDIASNLLSGIVWSISGGGVVVGPSNTNMYTVNWGTTVGTYNLAVTGSARAYAGQTAGLCTINDASTVDIVNETPVALACNNLVHVSMNGRCELAITPDMILEDMILPSSSYNVVLRDIQRDTIILNTRISQKYLTKTIEARVVQECGQNSCWGLVKLEDKSIPTLVCNPDVTIDCNQLTGPQVTGFPLKPDAIVTPISDNKFLVKNYDYCSDVILQYFDLVTQSDCTGPFSSVVTRTWLVTDISGNSSTCSSDIYINKANSIDIVFPQNYDEVLGPNPSLDACGNWPKLANGHPDPSYTGSPQGVFCLNVTVDFQDTKIPKCRGTRPSNYCENGLLRTFVMRHKLSETKP
ncbi:MAG: hypothetical protein IPN29_13200 [Saprospiraceae bacterium]|nr:hypothetical protein [Saprospiraceae bacterium]